MLYSHIFYYKELSPVVEICKSSSSWEIKISNVSYVPNLTKNLLFVNYISKHGYVLDFMTSSV
jgi:hypothetical protein